MRVVSHVTKQRKTRHSGSKFIRLRRPLAGSLTHGIVSQIQVSLRRTTAAGLCKVSLELMNTFQWLNTSNWVLQGLLRLLMNDRKKWGTVQNSFSFEKSDVSHENILFITEIKMSTKRALKWHLKNCFFKLTLNVFKQKLTSIPLWNG